MAGDVPAVEVDAPAAPAVDDLLADAPAKPAADAAAPTPESKPEGDKPKADDSSAKPEGDAELLADDGEGKPKDKADGPTDAEPSGAPETYEAFTPPEGVTIDEAALAKATPVFKELGLSQANAQKLVDLFAETQQQAVQSQVDGFTQLKKDWVAEIKADPEFGGANLDKTTGAAKTLIAKYGDKDFLNVVREWGWNNNPGFLRMCARIAADLSEDTLIIPDAAAQAGKPKRPEDLLYAESTSKKD